MESLGQVLQRYRKEAKFTLDGFEKLTKISRKYLELLEADRFSELPGEFYVRQHIRTYAKFLGLSADKLMSHYESQVGLLTPEKLHPELEKARKPVLTPQRAKFIGLLSIGILLFSYLLFQVNNIYKAPFLEVTTPSENLIINQEYIEIRGKTESEAMVSINNRQIYTDSQGYFSLTLDLRKGINLVKISAQKKHSKESIIFREILVQ